MSADTREDFLKAATHLFAEKGFYGASIANIADALGMTKQTLLHYFGTKERLYGEVLERVCAPLVRAARDAPDLQNAIAQVGAITLSNPDAAQLLMRELLDNRRRAETAKNWYLKPFLDRLIELLQAATPADRLDRPRALTQIYQLLGAVNYFAISGPTLTQMYGAGDVAQMHEDFAGALDRLVEAVLRHGG